MDYKHFLNFPEQEITLPCKVTEILIQELSFSFQINNLVEV